MRVDFLPDLPISSLNIQIFTYGSFLGSAHGHLLLDRHAPGRASSSPPRGSPGAPARQNFASTAEIRPPSISSDDAGLSRSAVGVGCGLVERHADGTAWPRCCTACLRPAGATGPV